MNNLRVLIPAAGRGSRAGLPYPKTLYPVDGTPILHRLFEVLSFYDANPTVVVSPQGEPLIRSSLHQSGYNANLVVQPQASGMGDAVLCFQQSPAAAHAEHVLMVWGDLANLQPRTVASLVHSHFSSNNDFTFVTRLVDQAYTIVQRDASNKVLSVRETREQGSAECEPGERDIGLFMFRPQPVFTILQSDCPERYGRSTGEHGFLYVIEYLAASGFLVDALPIATDDDLVSLNALSDLRESTTSSSFDSSFSEQSL